MKTPAPDPESWSNRSPGDLSLELPVVHRSDVCAAVAASAGAAAAWGRLPLEGRIELLAAARSHIEVLQEDLARGISLETGKPIREARGELGAVIAKFDLTFADARAHLADLPVAGGPHPALVRRRPRGPAAVIAPFNFPLHLGHGAALAHLVAGNPVLFKPSPLAATVAGRYAEAMASALPRGVFTLVQGGAATGRALSLDPAVRSVCFTGGAAAGRALLAGAADDLGKEIALELGGKNSLILCADGDLRAAAVATAEGMCLTAGQRCNATSRVLVEREVSPRFVELLLEALRPFVPGNPLSESTRLGPLISAAAAGRHRELCSRPSPDWILKGRADGEADGLRGHYVTPGVLRLGPDTPGPDRNELLGTETFCPILTLEEWDSEAEAIELNNSTPFGLTCSIFTRSEARFLRIAAEVKDGNVYANLPTTFSPSTLPFGGWGSSGNRRPGGRGFIRFVTEEQAVQAARDGFSPAPSGAAPKP